MSYCDLQKGTFVPTFTYEKEEMICNKPPQLVARPQRRPQS